MIQEKPGQVSFGRACIDFFKGYFDFRGRSTRAGYFYVELPLVVILIVLALQFSKLFGGDFDAGIGLAILPFFIPILALQTRRYRDVGANLWEIIVLILLPFVLGFIFPNLSSSATTSFQLFVSILPTNYYKEKQLMRATKRKEKKESKKADE